VITTAVTPVVVALVGEGVRRPVDKIGAVASTVTEKDMPEQENRSEKAKEQRPTRRHHHLRIALIIEALAFVIAVAAITAIELVGYAAVDPGVFELQPEAEPADATADHRHIQFQCMGT
jgi:hypothetical protein